MHWSFDIALRHSTIARHTYSKIKYWKLANNIINREGGKVVTNALFRFTITAIMKALMW
jgi:hypothetical protein